jgi:hypothetical protein
MDKKELGQSSGSIDIDSMTPAQIRQMLLERLAKEKGQGVPATELGEPEAKISSAAAKSSKESSPSLSPQELQAAATNIPSDIVPSIPRETSKISVSSRSSGELLHNLTEARLLDGTGNSQADLEELMNSLMQPKDEDLDLKSRLN